MPPWADALLVAGGYVVGSAPVVYLLARQRGVDLRRVGTGNVGSGALFQVAGPRAGLIGLFAEFGKGALPVAAGRVLDFDLSSATLAGVAALVGQMWPLFLGFKGGRGNGVALGIGLVATPVALGIALAAPAAGSFAKVMPHLLGSRRSLLDRWHLGRPFRNGVPLGMLGGLVLLPVASALLMDPPAVTRALALVPALVLMRRVTGGIGQVATSRDKGRALMSLLLLDRVPSAGDPAGGAAGDAASRQRGP